MANISGDNNDNNINGTNLDDTIVGAGGNDTINASNGNDVVYGDGTNAADLGSTVAPIMLAQTQAIDVDCVGDNAFAGEHVIYHNVATTDGGAPVSARLVLVAKSSPGLTVDLIGNYTGLPIVLNGAGQTATMRLEFFDPSTGEDVSISSSITFGDLQGSFFGRESVSVATDDITAYSTAQSSRNTVVNDGDTVKATGGGGFSTSATNPAQFINFEFENATSFEFTMVGRSSDSGYSVPGQTISNPNTIVLTTPVEEPIIDGDDLIFAGGGDDLVYGGGGNDTLHGEDGRDTLNGEDGDDVLNGGGSDDVLSGGAGADVLDGGTGNDDLSGGLGNDTLMGGTGQDTLSGGEGDDLLEGGDGDDSISGNDGNDTLVGGQGQDELFGGAGDDELSGGAGDDTLRGEDGDDTLILDGNNDHAYGGDGNDTFIASAGEHHVYGGEHIDGSDIDVLDLSGTAPYNIVYTGAESGKIEFLDNGGNIVNRMTFSEIERIICFTPGTLIATMQGERLVEDLMVGDQVFTRDNGSQEICWIGHKTVSLAEQTLSQKLQPILIRKGALGDNLPTRDIRVSPNHRVLMNSAKTQLYFDEPEVLVAAKHLVGAPGIEHTTVAQVEYIHFMCKQHEVVLTNGAWTETFQPGDYSMGGLGMAQQDEIMTLFPELKEPAGLNSYAAARRSLKQYESRLLINA